MRRDKIINIMAAPEETYAVQLPGRVELKLACVVYNCSETHFRDLHERYGNILYTDKKEGSKKGCTFVDQENYHQAMQPLPTVADKLKEV